MNYRILCIGKIKDCFYRRGIEEISRLLEKNQHKLEIFEFPDEKIPANLKEKNKESFLEKECQRLEQKITNRDYVIALCIEGKEITTRQHKEYVVKAKEDGYESITYIIGGSLGLPEQIKKRANLKMSFSKMTFPHQMMRLVLCEEIANLSFERQI